MTRPTDEQIKALRKGDVVTVQGVVEQPFPDSLGNIIVSIKSGGMFADKKCFLPSSIVTVEPKHIKVGDRVRYYKITDDLGVVRYIENEQAAVFFDSGVFCVYNLDNLTVIP